MSQEQLRSSIRSPQLSKESSIQPTRSQNGSEIPPFPSASVEKPISIVRSPKAQSPIASIHRTTATSSFPPSPTKVSTRSFLKSQKSNKRDSLQLIQAENKSLKTLSLNNEVIDKNTTPSPKRLDYNNGIERELKDSEKAFDAEKPVLRSNIDKIANMSMILTNEANDLRESIKSLSEDIVRTKQTLSGDQEDVNFPYHLFLIEIIVNKINMKCECFDLDYNNLVISAKFLGKRPVTLYDSSYGKVHDFSNLNVGKSALFAMTYDKICNIKEFVINLHLTKQPPCSSCVTKIAETKIDYTKEFSELRQEVCKKWITEQPNDNIICTTSTPLNKNMFFLFCGESDHSDTIGIIELSTRMSFLGKEITTAFCASSKPKCTSVLKREDNGISMYSCQNVEMDSQGKILLDENTFTRKEIPRSTHTISTRGCESPLSQLTSRQGSPKQYMNQYASAHKNQQDYLSKYDEIFTKINTNELKIRVPKTTKIERNGIYDKTNELCSCEDTPYNTGDQIQFDLPRDYHYPERNNTYTSKLKYTCTGYDKNYNNKEKKIINITPSNCPVPINMKKKIDAEKDVFILKIGKKLETKDKKTDLEIELVTPKAPASTVKAIENNHISQQWSSSTIKDKTPKTEKIKDKQKTKKNKSLTSKKHKKRDKTKLTKHKK